MHQGDVAIIMPQFYDGAHVGWAFSNVHVADVGGMGVSGFAPGARSVYDEGLRFGADPDHRPTGRSTPAGSATSAPTCGSPTWCSTTSAGMIAANNVAQRKLTEVIDRFGLERFQEYCEINKASYRGSAAGSGSRSCPTGLRGRGVDRVRRPRRGPPARDRGVGWRSTGPTCACSFAATRRSTRFINGTQGRRLRQRDDRGPDHARLRGPALQRRHVAAADDRDRASPAPSSTRRPPVPVSAGHCDRRSCGWRGW